MTAMTILLAARAAVWLAVFISVVLILRSFKVVQILPGDPGRAIQENVEIIMWVVSVLVLGYSVDRILGCIIQWVRRKK